MKNYFGNLGLTTLAAAAMLAVRAAQAEKPADKPVPAAAKTNAAPVTAAVPKSNFEVPAKPEDGRDPFFPGSDRLFGAKLAPVKAGSSSASALVFNGISGTRERPLAMINGHTFGQGEEATVNTATGRVHVRCLEISGDVAMIEVGGERRELRFQNR